MNRLGLLPPSSLEGEQKQVYDSYDQHVPIEPLERVQTKDEQGCLLGPAGVLIHNPDVLDSCNSLQSALSTTIRKCKLPKHVQEIASLVVGARTQAAFQIYAHSKSSGFPQEYLDDIRLGMCPPEMDIKGQVAFEVATELGKPGVLSETVWRRSVEALGVEGTAALIQCVSFYTFLSTISNGFDVQLPARYLSAVSSAGSSPRSSISPGMHDDNDGVCL